MAKSTSFGALGLRAGGQAPAMRRMGHGFGLMRKLKRALEYAPAAAFFGLNIVRVPDHMPANFGKEVTSP